MRTGRSYIATAIAIGAIALTGCAADVDTSSNGNIPSNEDWGDEDKFPGVGGAFQQLSLFAGTCTVSGTGGTALAIEMPVSSTMVLSVRGVDSQLLVNGRVCPNTAGLTSKKVKTVAITVAGGGASTNEAVVLDLLGGTFAPGVKGANNGPAVPGMTVNLGADDTDTLAIRGSTKPDLFAIGKGTSPDSLVALNNDAYADLKFTGGEGSKITISLAAGADTFTATPDNTAGLGDPYPAAISVFGGGGIDKLTGGPAADIIRGGADADLINGKSGNDELFGDEGDDTFSSGTAEDGADTFDCGANSDTVSYAERTEPLNISIATPDDDNGTAGDLTDDVPVKNDGQADTDTGTAGDQSEADHLLAGCEKVVGGTKADKLYGDSAANELSGGEGNDLLQGGTGADVLSGGAGTDTVSYEDRDNTVDITADLDGTADDGVPTTELDTIKTDVENLIGGAGDDTLTGDDKANELTGGAGDDTLNGGGGDDLFHESAASYGDDDACGGTGGDADTDDNGGDTIDGGAGLDTVDYSGKCSLVTVSLDDTANDGVTTLASGTLSVHADAATWADNRVWTASAEADNVKPTVENVVGTDFDDELVGQAAPVGGAEVANDFNGGDGDDKIDTKGGDDSIGGGAGHDTIVAGAGDDSIEGGADDDLLDCGTGDDIAFEGFEATSAEDTCEILL